MTGDHLYYDYRTLFNAMHDVTLKNGALYRCIDEGMILELPTADVRENVRATLRDDHGSYRCTNCNALISDEIDYVLEDYKPIQFCPNCGAEMRGE